MVTATAHTSYDKSVSDIRMVSIKNARYIAYSPDVVILLIISHFSQWQCVQMFISFSSQRLVAASLEVNKKIVAALRGYSVHLTLPDVARCENSDETFRKYVTTEQMGHVFHQCIVLQVKVFSQSCCRTSWTFSQCHCKNSATDPSILDKDHCIEG